MAHIQISRQHNIPVIQLREKIDLIMRSLEDKLSFTTEWENDSEFSFRRKGANGKIYISDEKFELTLNLGLMYRAMRAQIESKIISEVNTQLI